jgi:hypothetical protein
LNSCSFTRDRMTVRLNEASNVLFGVENTITDANVWKSALLAQLANKGK